MTNWLRRIYETDLYRNSLWLMASSALSSFFGFFFWTIAARLYETRDVGIASTLISAVTLLVSVASLGLGISFARFLPAEKDKRRIINPALTLSGLLICVLSLLFCLGAGRWSNELALLGRPLYLVSFPLVALFALQNGFLDTIYVSARVSFYTFLKNLVQSLLKVGLLFPLLAAGAFGIFSSFGLAVAVSFLVSFLLFMGRAIPGYSFSPSIEARHIAHLFSFAFANYLASFLSGSATMLFPLLITATVSPETTAYFYVSWMIGNLLLVIPNSVAFNVLSEGASGQDASQTFRKARRLALLILAPAVVFVIAGAHYILLLFGAPYAQNGASLLRIVASGSLLFALNSIALSRLNLEGRVASVVLINAFLALTTLGVGYYLLGKMGLAGIGLGFLLAHLLVAGFFLVSGRSQ